MISVPLVWEDADERLACDRIVAFKDGFVIIIYYSLVSTTFVKYFMHAAH